MHLSNSFIRAKSPCAAGFRWLLRHYREGGDYQRLLDALVAEGRVGDACWLMTQFGPTDSVLVIDNLDVDSLVFSGSVEVRGSLEATALIRVGRSIRARGSVRAGEAIVTGGEIRVEGNIRSDGRIEAGDDIRAGYGIDADQEISCAGQIRAGWTLRAGGAMKLGGDAFVKRDIVAGGPVQCAKGIHALGDIVAESLRADHGIRAGGSILCTGHLEAGWGILAGQSIVTEGAIKAGESINAGEEIRAGGGYGIFAGLNVRSDSWDCSARVTARTKPAGLMSGSWNREVPG